NLIDIDVYFASVGVIGAVLIGSLFRKNESQLLPQAAWPIGVFGALALVVMAFSSLAMVSSELQHRAQAEYEDHKYTAAVATLDEAKSIMPLNSSLFHDAGEILLDVYSRGRDPKQLADAKASFQQAIALSPMKIGPHVGLGLCLSFAHDVDSAL